MTARLPLPTPDRLLSYSKASSGRWAIVIPPLVPPEQVYVLPRQPLPCSVTAWTLCAGLPGLLALCSLEGHRVIHQPALGVPVHTELGWI